MIQLSTLVGLEARAFINLETKANAKEIFFFSKASQNLPQI